MKKTLEDYLHLYLPLFKAIPPSHPDSIFVVEAGNFDSALRLNWTPILRPLSDMTEEEINEVCSMLLSKKTTCGRIWRSEERDFIIATFKQEKPLPPYDKDYKSMSMGIYIKNNCQVDYKWSYYTEENCEGSCGITTEPLHNHNEITRYLLSKHFDLFGLIEAGLAIDKTKM